jgi:hypothetical protein
MPVAATPPMTAPSTYFGFVPLADGDQLIGTITDRDIVVRALATGAASSASVVEFITRDPQTVLEALALTLLNRVCSGDKVGSMRGVALVSVEAPEIAHAIYEAGPRRSLRELGAWLAEQTRLGRMSVADPEEAAAPKGQQVAQALIAQGADRILAQLSVQTDAN